MMARIVMLIHEEQGSAGASFPDLPGCTTVARTADDLIAKAPEIVCFHMAGLDEDGVAPTRFRTVSEVRADATLQEDLRDATVVLLDVDLPTRSVRINISVDEGMLKRIDRAAKATGETRSGFLVAAAKARLQAAE